MGFVQAISSGFRNYVGFSGRACRSEFWYWSLFVCVTVFFFGVILPVSGMGDQWFVVLVISPLLWLPSFAVGARRLHDIDLSGWWYLFGFIPVIGTIVLVIWFVERGTTGENRFGPDPLNDTLMVSGPDAN